MVLTAINAILNDKVYRCVRAFETPW